MDLKVMFIPDYLSRRFNFSELCAAHSISELRSKGPTIPGSKKIQAALIERFPG
ncbi:Mobile element protein [Pseudomonas chlororaphis subsp. aurantiaca]|nr:Mobile element protein [Pseudomonas chlororaphis subsp. aurantiaca]